MRRGDVAVTVRYLEFYAGACDKLEGRSIPMLVVGSPDPSPAAVRATGRVCYPSANRAVMALDHLWWRSRWLARRDLT